MNQTDMNYFTQPYQNLQRDMVQMMNPQSQMNGGMGGGQGQMGGPGQMNGPMNGQFGQPSPFNGQMNGPMNNQMNRPPLFGAPPMGQQMGPPMGGLGQPNFAPPPSPLFMSQPMMGQQGPAFGPQMGSPIMSSPFSSPMMQQPMMGPPMMQTSSFGYGSPAPMMVNQGPMFAQSNIMPQYYSSALPNQQLLNPGYGTGSLGAYANFNLSIGGTPSVFSTNPMLAPNFRAGLR